MTIHRGDVSDNITISEKPTINITGWNSTGGIVEISILSNYTTQYRIGRTGQWRNYNGELEVDNGETVYSRYSSSEGVGQTTSKIVEDTNGPEVTIDEPIVGGEEITIKATAVDNEMGMPVPPTYNYYIKLSTDTYYESVGHNTTGEFTYTDLQGLTSYDIRVITTDIAGNTGAATISTQTQSTDLEPPTIDLTVERITTRSLRVNANAFDEGSGVKDYVFYIGTTEGEYGEVITQQSGVYTFDNLTQNTTYYIKVEVTDNLGNKGEQEVSTQTYLIPSANEAVQITTNWHESDNPDTATADVSFSTDRDYDIVYTDLAENGIPNNWESYSSALTQNNGDTVYVCLTDGLNYGEYATVNIRDFDGPEVVVNTDNIKTNAITVNVEAQDTGAGMPETVVYNYYIKRSDEQDYTLVKGNEPNSSYTFTELQAQTTYNIKVETKDKIGNVGEGTVNGVTREFSYTIGNITFGNPVWKNGKAEVAVTNNTEYIMQYKVIPKDVEITDEIIAENNWTNAVNRTETVRDLDHLDKIVARLTDGTNVTSYATTTIRDDINPNIISVEGNPTNWTNEDVTLTINAVDNETGLADAPYSFDNGNTWQAENSKEYSENTNGIIIQVKDKAGNIASYNSINITRIDKTGPALNVQTTGTSNRITVNIVSCEDNGIGMEEPKTYTYYIANSEAELSTAEGDSRTQTTKEYTGLTQNTTYYIKVTAQDRLGNITEVIREVTTGSLDADTSSLKISDETWQNGVAQVTITNESEYSMQYQVVRAGEEYDVNSNWIDESRNEITLNNLNHGDTVYARLTDGSGINYSSVVKQEILDEIEPEIQEVTGNPTNWTNQNVTLEVTARDNETGLANEAYSFDNGNSWQAENTKEFTTNTNGIIIQVRDIAGNITTYDSIDITLIDKDGPNVTVQEQVGTTTREVTVRVTAGDSGVGMPDTITYTYYYKKSTETNWSEGETSEEDTYTFDGLTSGTQYNIRVETNDALGNIGTGETNITTQNLLYEENVRATGTVWHNGLATITVENNSDEYDMQYQIGLNGSAMQSNGSWTRVSEKTTDIVGVPNNSLIYVRLTDGVNATQGYATIIVDNPSEDSYTEEELAQNTTRSSYDILGVSVSNNELQVVIDEEQQGATLYSYYYKNINEDEYTLISSNTYYNEPAVIKDVVAGGTYKILVTTLDANGNVTRSENKATTIALEGATANQTYSDNRTYIDNSTEITLQNSQGETRDAEVGYTVSLPASFKVSENASEQKVSDGVVLKDSSNNEYVWIPVDDAIYDGVTQYPTGTGNASTRTYKPMAIRQEGYEDYYEGIIYSYNGSLSYRNSSNTGIGHSSYREPSLLTNNSADGYTWRMSNIIGNRYDADSNLYSTILGFDSTMEMGEYMVANYNSMVTSVDSYGGFYVGRYETTFETASNSTYVVGSRMNGQVLSSTNWYNMYLYQDSGLYSSNPYSNMASVSSSMIWGSQWDSMLNYILKGGDSSKVTSRVGQQKNVLSNSGQDSSDKINNIYDLGSNAYEWTQEANNINYRVYRGGGYDSTVTSTPSTRSTVVPDDMGPIFGTRLSLYMQSTNDVTGPAVNIQSTNPASNAITVTVRAVDRETGVSSYVYYIREENSNFQRAGEGTNEYIYTGLTQNTKYYIRVDAVDGAGNVGQSEVVEVTTTGLGAVANTAITLNQMYGSDGNGVVQLNLAEEYSNTGYEIRYKVNGQGNYTSGSLITGLSNGDVITAVVADDNNMSEDEFTINVEGLEEYGYIDSSGKTYTEEEAIQNPGNTSYDTNITYTDESGAMATIPAGFKVGVTSTVNTINNGLVVQDEDGNEFVWVPATAIETNTSTTSSEKAMARYQSGYSEDSSKQFFEGILYSFSGTTSTKRRNSPALGTSTYREPSLVTGGADYTWNVGNGEAVGTSYDTLEDYYKRMGFGTNTSVNAFSSYTEFGAYMNQEYSNMIQSVDKYGGFYVGRYETSTTNNENTVTATSVVQSKLNAKPINNGVWYRDYYALDSNINLNNPYYGSRSVTSSMIWGSQWDAMINWMLQDERTASFVTEITGNHTEVVSNTGMYTNDLAKNIFDLAANVTEWTQTGDSSNKRYARGSTAGNINTVVGQFTASSYNTRWSPPTNSNISYTLNSSNGDVYGNFLGTRLALYIKDSTDTTAPEVTVDNAEAGTNNVEVRVTAKDNESGINKYTYSISLVDFNSPDFNEETSVVQKITAYADVYTFTGLNQNQTYYVRVEAINGVGLTGTAYSEEVKTSPLNVQEGAIVLEKVWGKDRDGKAYFEISDETNFEVEGYYLEHQVDKGGTNGYDENGEWIQTDTVTNLSVGDVIYTRLSDGINNGAYIMSSPITELETFSEVYDETTVYEDYDTVVTEDGTESQELVGTAYIPAGFRVSTSSLTNKIANGLVIEDEDGNQYVWIPVENAVYDEQTPINASYKPMFRLQQNSNQYYESVYYTFSGITSSGSSGYRLGTANQREPSLVTNSSANYSWIYTAGNSFDATNYNKLADLGINSPNDMGAYLNNQYTEMAQSIIKYGGYYVGRYETSLYTEQGTNSTNGVIAKSIKDVTPMASVDWYKMYLVENSGYTSNLYNKSSSVGSMMITGSQWDTMLNFILTGSDKNKVTAVTGNHTGTREETGLFGSDIMSNIFDLGSNVREWTLGAYSSTNRVYRGGLYSVTGTVPASIRGNDYPTLTSYSVGSRLSLYVK